MVPTEEEKQKIQEAQLANPDVPLGSAEQFLLALSSISDLTARLQLWAFKLDYESLEQVQSHVPHLLSALPPLPAPAVLSAESSVFLVGTSHVRVQEVPSWLGMGCRSPRQAWAWVDHEVVVLMGKGEC